MQIILNPFDKSVAPSVRFPLDGRHRHLFLYSQSWKFSFRDHGYNGSIFQHAVELWERRQNQTISSPRIDTSEISFKQPYRSFDFFGGIRAEPEDALQETFGSMKRYSHFPP